MFYVSVYHHVAFVMQHKVIFTYTVFATWLLKHAKVCCDCINDECSLFFWQVLISIVYGCVQVLFDGKKLPALEREWQFKSEASGQP